MAVAGHPGSRVLATLVVAAGAMAVPTVAGLAATGALVAGLAGRVPAAPAAFWRLVRRLRWVFLFIVLLHGWFTPGAPVVAWGGGWVPTGAGLARGAELVSVIVVMVGLVAVLVRTTPPPELAAGVAWLLAPLARWGLPVERFGRLLAWTLDRVEPVQAEARRVRNAIRLRLGGEGGLLGRLRLEARTAQAVLWRAREAADRNAEALFLRGGGAVRRPGRPAPRDWLLVGGAAAWSTGLAVIGMGVGW